MCRRAATYSAAVRPAPPFRPAALRTEAPLVLLAVLLALAASVMLAGASLAVELDDAPEPFLFANLDAPEPSLLANLYDAPPAERGSAPTLLATLDDGRAVFAASDPRHGREPWVTDGSAAGTLLLGDLAPGPEGSLQPTFRAAAAGPRVFFLAGAGQLADLWVTDGTPDGTRPLVTGIHVDGVEPSLRADAAGRVFLLALDRDRRGGLWVSDGTPGGTRRLPLPTLPERQPGEVLDVLGARVLFVAGSGVGGSQELWGSDGTAAGTRRLAPGPVAGPPYGRHPAFGVVAPAFHVAVLDDGTAVVLQDVGPPGSSAVALWRTDGTPAGTRRVRVLDGRFFPDTLAAGPRAAFCLWEGADPPLLWWSDGTAAGTRSLFEEPADCFHGLRWRGDRLFLSRDHFSGGSEPTSSLWSVAADGEPQRLADLPGAVVSPLVPFRDGVAFLVELAPEQALWASDGTAAGTRRLVHLGPRQGANALLGSFELAGGETLLLTLGQGENTFDLFASDGGAGDPRRLTDLGFPESLLSSFPEPALLPVAAGVVFAVDDGVHGREPWITDGTATGTRLLTNLSHAEGDGDAWPRGLTPYGDEILFLARDAEGWGLWRTDGTAAGTRRLHRLPFSPPPEYDPAFHGPASLVRADGLFYFYVPTTDRQRVDLKVADLEAGELRHLGRFPSPGEGVAVAVDGALLWAPRLGDNLVFSDGTAAGTRSLALRDGATAAGLAALADGTALAVAFKQTPKDAVTESGLWRTDGTPQGTRRILATEPFPALGALTPRPDGTALFGYAGSTGSHPAPGGLWRTDGTPEGTWLAEDLGGLWPRRMVDTPQGLFFFLDAAQNTELWLRPAGGDASSPLLQLTLEGLPLRWVDWAVPFASGLLFTGSDALQGAEPWVSDGTAAGTRRLGDLSPGAVGYPEPPAVGDAQAFFLEAGGLWRTDGTPPGTYPVAGTYPAGGAGPAAGGEPAPRPYGELAVVGRRLLFAAQDFATGRELWWLPARGLAPPPPPPPPSFPAAPGALRASSGVDGVRLTWTSPPGDVRFYDIEVRTPESAAFRQLLRLPAAPVASQNVFVCCLPPAVPHVFRVRAGNPAGASPPSNEATASALAELPLACRPSDTVLCLLGERFAVTAWWRDPRSGDFGRARAEPLPGNDLSGTFWFFRDGNVELIVKALDGTAVNRRWWIFTGGLTDVEYWLRAIDLSVTESDPASAVTWYHHRSGNLCGFADTDAFAGEPGLYFPLPAAAGAAAAEAPTHLDLLGGRYRVSVEWRDPRSGDSGVGHAVPGSNNTGFFWFFRPGNVELVVKVLDGTPVNGHRWVFYGGLTDVGYTLRVEDLLGDEVRTYPHPAGDLCGGADTSAFAPSLPL